MSYGGSTDPLFFLLCYEFSVTYQCHPHPSREYIDMSNKLYYKLGLEELVEPEVTTPVVELQGSQLEVEQLHHELQEDINRVDTLRADTDALEDVQAALEQALKGAMLDRNALVFAQKTIQMVDKRWGFGYATPSMESSDPSALIASMEDGIGQRLKDMGKALLEMLKRVWAKLKEWGNKFLQLLGLKKKKLETLVNKIVSHIHDAKTYPHLTLPYLGCHLVCKMSYQVTPQVR